MEMCTNCDPRFSTGSPMHAGDRPLLALQGTFDWAVLYTCRYLFQKLNRVEYPENSTICCALSISTSLHQMSDKNVGYVSYFMPQKEKHTNCAQKLAQMEVNTDRRLHLKLQSMNHSTQNPTALLFGTCQ